MSVNKSLTDETDRNSRESKINRTGLTRVTPVAPLIGTSSGQLSAASVEVIRFNFFRVLYTLRIKRLSFNGINAPP